MLHYYNTKRGHQFWKHVDQLEGQSDKKTKNIWSGKCTLAGWNKQNVMLRWKIKPLITEKFLDLGQNNLTSHLKVFKPIVSCNDLRYWRECF